MTNQPVFAFTDCKDSNAIVRLTARLQALFPDKPIYANGINSDLEASGCIVDTLDALRKGLNSHIIIGNLAPREEKKHKNGAPFYFGYIKDEIVIANYTCFSLCAKLGLIDTIYETDVYTVCREFLDEDEAKRIANSQFRSFEYVPLLAMWVYEKKDIPNTEISIHPDANQKIWWVDNFGNVKTTFTRDEILLKVKEGYVDISINDNIMTFPFYEKLSDVPVHERAVIIGSSGYGNIRFAEIVIQGKSAASEFKLSVGDNLE